MAGGYQVEPEYQRLLAEIANLREDVRNLQGRATRIPTLQDDPDPRDPINLWFMDDGRLRGRLRDGTTVEYSRSTHTHPGVTGNPQGGSGSTAPPPPPPYSPSTQVYESGADWTQSYNKGGAQQRATSDLYYGHSGDSYNAEQKSMIHFPNLGVLAPGPVGTRIAEVWLWIHNNHTWYNNPTGAKLRLGLHNSAGKPGSFQEVRWDPYEIWVGKPSEQWYQLPVYFGELMRDGGAQGITFNQRTTTRSFYGIARSDVRLKIVHVK